MAPASLVKQATLRGSTFRARLGTDPVKAQLTPWAAATARL